MTDESANFATESSSLKEFTAALCKAQAVMRNPIKNAENTFHKSKYADLATVLDTIRESLTSNGFCWVQPSRYQPHGVHILETRLMHTSGEWMASFYPIEPAQKTPPGTGSAMTYARRYALMAMVGVFPEKEDDDGAAYEEGEAPNNFQKPKNKNAPRNTSPAPTQKPQSNRNEPNTNGPKQSNAAPKPTESIAKRFDNFVKWFAQHGYSREELYMIVDCNDESKLTEEDMKKLHENATRIKETKGAAPVPTAPV